MTFKKAVAIALNGGDISMMSKSVKKSADRSSVRKDLIPLSENAIRGNNNGTQFIASVNDFIEKVSGVVIIR